MFNKFIVIFACFFFANYTEANPKHPTTTEPATTNNKIQIRFQKDVEDSFIAAAYDCINDPRKVPCFLKKFGNGEYSYTRLFRDIVYCLNTKAGFANKETGMINGKKMAAAYKKECNAKDVIQKCDKYFGYTPEETNFQFYMCFFENTNCYVNMLPESGSGSGM